MKDRLKSNGKIVVAYSCNGKKVSRRHVLGTIGTLITAAVIQPVTADADPGKKKLKADTIRQNGVLKIRINGQIYEPWAFRSFRPGANTISDFYGSGVRLMNQLHTGLNSTLKTPYSTFGEYWIGPDSFDFSVIDKQMEMFQKNAPDAYFNIMLQLDTREWYLSANPECSNTFWDLAQTAGYQKWRNDTAESLNKTLNYIEEKYGDRVFAYSLMCGMATEWFTANVVKSDQSEDLNKPVRSAAFQSYVKDPEAQLPKADQIMKRSDGIFFDPVKDSEIIRYWKFQADIIADTILYFVKQTRKVIKKDKLIGLFFGYVHWTGNLYRTGHLSYEKIWQSKDIDMIYQPARYGRQRSFEGASGFQSAIDSAEVNNKLSFQEIDHATHLSPKGAPTFSQQLKSEFQARMTLRREFALTRIKRVGLWWFDMYNGNFASEVIMKDVAQMSVIGEKLGKIKLQSAAQIAVFGDPMSVHYAPTVSTDFLRLPPETLSRIGAPYDLFTLSDINNPEFNFGMYKLVIMLNAFFISEPTKRQIERKLKKDGRTILWIYAAGYLSDNGNSVDSISTLTEIRVKRRQPGTGRVTVAKQSESYSFREETSFGFSSLTPDDDRQAVESFKPVPLIENSPLVDPLFEIDDDEVSIFGVYTDTGTSAIGYKKLAEYTSIWTAVPCLPATVYREIARKAGVHIYYEGYSPVYVNNRLLAIHIQENEKPVLHLTVKKTVLEELFDGGRHTVSDYKAEIKGTNGEVKLYLIHNENKSG